MIKYMVHAIFSEPDRLGRSIGLEITFNSDPKLRHDPVWFQSVKNYEDLVKQSSRPVINQPDHGSDSTATRVLDIRVFRSVHNFHLLDFLFVVAAQSPKLVDVACPTSAAEPLPPWEWDLKPKGASSPK